MKAGKSWSLRDVDESTRSALLKAAEKSGLSVNDWLGTRSDPGNGTASSAPEPAPAAPTPPGQSAPLTAEDDDPSREVREAIERLTARLGLMDEKARTAVSGLPARLAEIENRLAFLVEAKQSPEERARSLADASTMIDALVRDIDGAALRISTLGGKPTAPPVAPGESPRLVAPAAKPGGAPAPMSPAAEQLADIRFQLDALLADGESAEPHQPPSRAASTSSEAVLRVPDPRADKAESPAAPTQIVQSPADISGAADQLRRLDSQISEIMTRLPAKKEAELAAAIREISSRQRMIDERAEATAMRREQRALSDTVTAIHSEVSSLAARVASIGHSSAGDEAAILGLAKRIDALAADRPADRGLLSEIRNELDQLKSYVAASARQATPPEIEARYGELTQRVNEFIAKVPDTARIDALGEEISELRHALEDGARGNQDRLETRLAEMARTFSDAAGRAPPPATVSVDVSKLEQRFDSLAKTVAMALSRSPIVPADGREPGEVTGRLDEISANIGRLLEKNEAAPTAAVLPPSPTVAALEGRLSQMAANINGLLDREATGDPAPVIERIESRLDTIAESVDGLFMGMPPSETNAILQHIDQRFDRITTAAGAMAPPALGRLEARLDQIAADLEHFGPPTAATIDQDGLNRRLDRMAATLADLARNTPSMVEIETLHGRLQGIADRIERVNVPENTIQADLEDIRTEVASIRAVHQRLQTLTERIDSMAAVQHQPLLAVAEIKDGIVAIRAMHDRIQSITDRIDRMSAAQRDPLPAEQMRAGFAALRTVQERVEAISERLGAIAPAAPAADTVEGIRAGVNAINAVHEEMRALADRIAGVAVQRAPTVILEDIRKDIVSIRSEIAERRATSTEPLERLVADLAKQVATVSRAPSDPSGITDLANRVTALAGELEEAKPRVQRLEDIEVRIARLQENLADTRKESVEAAKVEARAVVQDLSRMVATGEIDASVIGALVQDLESMKSNSGDSDRRVRTKLDAVNSTLAQVVARLSQLEGEASRRQTTAEPRTTIPEDWKTALAGPTLPPSAAAESIPEDQEPRERRADFIAAARRAAQAAAAEASRPRGADADEGKADKPGPLTRFSQAILNRKRTLLLAAAAIVLAVGALQIFAGRLNANGDTVRVAAAGSSAPPFLAAAAPVPQATAIAAPTVPAPLAAAPTTLAAAPPLLVAPATVDSDVAFAPPVYASPSGPQATPVATAPTAAPGAPAVAAPAQVIAASISAADAAPTPTRPLLDHAIGSDRLTNAALKGDPSAAYEVGSRYAAGTLVPRDTVKAAQWYQQAANAGLAVAEFRLGSLYERGDGVPQDLAQALTWYQHAADQGNVNAMHNLAVLLSNGVNGPADPKLALRWFLTAANYGLRDSQYNLGVIYTRGLGTTINLTEAYKWFAIAAQGGDTDAAARRDEVAQSLSAGGLAQAKTAVAVWTVKQPNPSANAAAVPAGGWDADTNIVSDVDKQALVKTIQTLLADAGYDPGPADGHVGPKTTRAVKDYQQKSGVAATGQVDQTLLASLSVGGR